MKNTTVNIKVLNEKAMKLLEELEDLQLIKVLDKKMPRNKTNMSEKLAGSLTKEQAEQMDKELQEMRSEWQRDI